MRSTRLAVTALAAASALAALGAAPVPAQPVVVPMPVSAGVDPLGITAAIRETFGTDSPAEPDDAEATLRLADERSRESRRETRERRRGAGPFHPVAGRFDYGGGGARFGAPRGGRMHVGQDVFAAVGTPLVAVRAGRVVERGSDGGRGHFVSIHSPAARQTYNYFHLDSPSPLREGERVRAGQIIGPVGCSGSCWGAHLHFEVRKGRDGYGEPLDPRPYLGRWPRAPRRLLDGAA